MRARLARTADGWWLLTPAGLVRLGLETATTGALLADEDHLAAAVEAAGTAAAADPRLAVSAGSVDLLSPVTAPARVVAQAVNYRSHAVESGFDPDKIPPVFFRKSSHSLTGPAGDVIRPDGLGFLDYEVELGLVIGADLPVGTTVTQETLHHYVAGLVVTNDVSARQIQLTKTQFYEAKSYPTFTPVGPWLALVDAADLARLGSLRLTLSVNGEVRQDALASEMIVTPAQALNALSRFQPLAPGDLLLTGTPGGTALKAPPKAVEKLAGLLPAPVKWQMFFRRQAGNPRYLRDGDLVTASIASADGELDLGTQSLHRRREDAMTTPAAAVPESTYGLLANAASTWPDAVATQWIPDPADYARCQSWTYAELASTVTRIANGLTRLGIQRDDAVTLCGPNCFALLAATLAAQAAGIAAPVSPALGADRIAGLIGRTRSPILVAAGPEADPLLWQQLTEVAVQARMRAIIALRPDGATGLPPALVGEPGITTMYLDELADGQPAESLAAVRPPRAADLAAFVHTGGTTGAPKIAAHTHANQLACARGIAEWSGLGPGDGVLAGLPLFHVNALIVTGIAPLLNGTRVVWPGPARLPRPGALPAVLEDRRALPDHRHVGRAHGLQRADAGASGRGHQLLAHPDRRCLPAAGSGPRTVRPAHRAAPARGLRAHRSDLRQHLEPARRRPARLGRPGTARPAGQGGPNRRRRTLAGLRAGGARRAGDRRPGRIRRVRHRPARRRLPGEPGRHSPRRLAGHRRPGPHRRRRLCVPHRPGQGPDHPRWTQHRSRA